MRRALRAALVAAAIPAAGVAVLLAAGQSRGNALAPQQAPDRLAALHREADALARRERTLLVELRQLQLQRQIKTEELARTERDLDDVVGEWSAASQRLAALEAQVASQRPQLAARLVQLYKLGRPGYARLLLDVDGLKSANRAYRSVSALAAADRRRFAAFERNVADLHATARTLARRTAALQALQAQAAADRQAADRAIAAHAALIARIDGRRDLNAKLAGEMMNAQEKLSALDAAALLPAPVPGGSPHLTPGELEWPASGRLSAGFGPQRAGVEIAAAAGEAARAIEDGVVAYADPFTGFGNLIVVAHGQRSYSLYGNLDRMAVVRGARVARGQALGTVGSGPSGKPGLYFELRIDGRAVDPVQWLKKR